LGSLSWLPEPAEYTAASASRVYGGQRQQPIKLLVRLERHTSVVGEGSFSHLGPASGAVTGGGIGQVPSSVPDANATKVVVSADEPDESLTHEQV
jgi:hypothetical protein